MQKRYTKVGLEVLFGAKPDCIRLAEPKSPRKLEEIRRLVITNDTQKWVGLKQAACFVDEN